MTKVKCPECGNEASKQDNFCTKCGCKIDNQHNKEKMDLKEVLFFGALTAGCITLAIISQVIEGINNQKYEQSENLVSEVVEDEYYPDVETETLTENKSTVEQADIEFILNREIFPFKDYLSFLPISDLESFVPCRDNWTFGDLLNDSAFDMSTVTWEYDKSVSDTTNGSAVIFKGNLKEPEYKITLYFVWNDGAKIPLLMKIEICTSDGSSTTTTLQDFVDVAKQNGMSDEGAILFYADSSISLIAALTCYGDEGSSSTGDSLKENSFDVPYVDIEFEKIGNNYSTFHVSDPSVMTYGGGSLMMVLYGMAGHQGYHLNKDYECEFVDTDFNEYGSYIGITNDIIVLNVIIYDSEYTVFEALEKEISSVEPLYIDGYNENNKLVERLAIWAGNNGYFVAVLNGNEKIKYCIATTDLKYIAGIPETLLLNNPEGGKNGNQEFLKD